MNRLRDIRQLRTPERTAKSFLEMNWGSAPPIDAAHARSRTATRPAVLTASGRGPNSRRKTNVD